MSNDHPNVETINRMTPAIFKQDHDTLAKIFTDDFVFHLRGPSHSMAGDHAGLGGFLGVIGSFFEATNGDIKLEQQFCVGTDGWAAEWEHATLGRNGKTLESRQRLRVPVRRRSDRRDVDVPRRAARRGRGILRLTRRPSGKLDDVVRAIEDARAACDDHRWGDAFRLLSSVELDALDIDDLDRLATALPHRPRRGRVRLLGPSPPDVHRRRRSAPGGVLCDATRAGTRLQRRLRPLSRLARPRGSYA